MKSLFGLCVVVGVIALSSGASALAAATLTGCDSRIAGTGFALDQTYYVFKRDQFDVVTSGNTGTGDFVTAVLTPGSYDIAFGDPTAGRSPVEVTTVACTGGGGGAIPESKADCKKGGFTSFADPAFRNQGRCVSAVAKMR